MSIDAIAHIGLAGFRRELDQIEGTARKVARGPLEDVEENAVSLITSENAAVANLRVVGAAHEMGGTLLDVFA